MWKVGGLKIETTAGRRIILPVWNRNWWKSAFFKKTVRTRKFSMWKFFGLRTHGIVAHSRFRICVLMGLATHFCLCYSCTKSWEGGKTRFASKIKVVYQKSYGLQRIFHAKSSWEKFLDYILKFLSGGFGMKFFWKPCNFFAAQHSSFLFFLNEGQLRPFVTWS